MLVRWSQVAFSQITATRKSRWRRCSAQTLLQCCVCNQHPGTAADRVQGPSRIDRVRSVTHLSVLLCPSIPPTETALRILPTYSRQQGATHILRAVHSLRSLYDAAPSSDRLRILQFAQRRPSGSSTVFSAGMPLPKGPPAPATRFASRRRLVTLTAAETSTSQRFTSPGSPWESSQGPIESRRDRPKCSARRDVMPVAIPPAALFPQVTIATTRRHASAGPRANYGKY